MTTNAKSKENLDKLFWGQDRWNLHNWPQVQTSDGHKVLYNLPINPNISEPPKPRKGSHKWDADYVRLPSSIHNQYPVKKSDGTTIIETRWEIIQTALLKPIFTSRDLEKAILSYNTKYEKLWKFTTLHKLFEEELEEEESFAFFEISLPKIIELALQLPDLIPNSIPLLKHGDNKSISMTQQQIACLLANAFLCTFPRRNTRKKNSEYGSFPDINFSRLFQAPEQKVIEKLKCICNYFRRVCSTMPKGVLTISRRYLPEELIPNWDLCDNKFNTIPIHVSVNGTIEENGLGMLQVDFANKFIGGGVLRSGSVQEEIRFVICPELLITRLFVEYLKPNEALFITGCEQFNKYSGYASTFSWNGNFIDETPYDSSRRRKTHIVAIDALRFIHAHHQFRDDLMLRELKKAYVGFLHTLKTPAPPVASGNWGCGAFKGSTHLKSLIQLMVCVVTKRPLMYFTFGDIALKNSILEMHDFLCKNDLTVGELWKYLKLFAQVKQPSEQLYHFIYEQKSRKLHVGSNNNTIKNNTFSKISKDTLAQSVCEALRKHEERKMYEIESCSSTSSVEIIDIQNKSQNLKKDKTETPSEPQTSSSSLVKKSLLEGLDEFYNVKKTENKEYVIINISKTAEAKNESSKMDISIPESENTTKMLDSTTEATPMEEDECIPASPETPRRYGCQATRQRNITDFFTKK